MKPAWVGVLVLAACASSTPAPSKPPPPIASGPHASRQALVREAFAAVLAGRADQLVALGGAATLYDRVFACKSPDGRGAYETARRHEADAVIAVARELSLTAVEVLAVEQLDRIAAPPLVRNARYEDCELRGALEVFDAKVRVRLTAGDAPAYTQTLTLGLVEHDARWYLARMTTTLGIPGGSELARVRQLSQRMCACTDRACAEAVQAEYVEWAASASREPPTHDDIDEVNRHASAYDDCLQRLVPPP